MNVHLRIDRRHDPEQRKFKLGQVVAGIDLRDLPAKTLVQTTNYGMVYAIGEYGYMVAICGEVQGSEHRLRKVGGDEPAYKIISLPRPKRFRVSVITGTIKEPVYRNYNLRGKE